MRILFAVSLTLSLGLLSACGGQDNTSSTNPQSVNLQTSAITPAQNLDLTCDKALAFTPVFLICETGNLLRSLNANIEQLQVGFELRATTQYVINLSALLGRSLLDPSWNLPPALGNTLATPLCAAGILPCVGDPYRYPEVEGPDGKVFYEQEAEVKPVVYYDQGCARISGRVWRPRNTGNRKLPAVVVKNGSIQANEQLYWWAVQPLVRAGYLVLTNDPRGQGQSDLATPRGEQGGNFRGAVFHEGLVNDLDFLLSSPSQPYPHEIKCKGTYPTKTAAFNPFHEVLDADRIGIAGHSFGAGGVTWVQSYDAPDSRPWPGLLTKTNPVKAIVAWDALGSRQVPLGPTLLSLLPTEALALGLPILPAILFNSGDSPPVSPRVPALGFTSEYGLAPVPYLRKPPREEHLRAFKDWSQAQVPVYQMTIAGTTHLDFSLGVLLPATSWCPDISQNACRGGWGRPMITHYTLAWFDRYLKQPGEAGYDDADARLLNDAEWAERLSFHFASARRFTTRAGELVQDQDIRMRGVK